MKIQGLYPAPDRLLWKNGQWIQIINVQDDGLTEDGQHKYIADFTVMDGESIEDALYAFTRMTNEPERDDKIIFNMPDVGEELSVKTEYPTLVPVTIFPTLPELGQLKKGQIYSYGNGAVMVVQDHERTIYAPELTPALFSFHRTITEGQEWIASEQVLINATRTYKGKIYKCIQAHQTQESWNPELTISVLWSEVQAQGVKPPQWVTGNWAQYTPIGFEVFDLGKVWKVKTLTHTWIQPSLTGNGAISWTFVRDWVA